jgi:hypothetical protein
LGLSKESAGKRTRQANEMDLARGKKARKWEKDTILTKRTYRSGANKGFSFSKR